MFQFFCKILLKLINWKIDGILPDAPQYIIIVGPHTSNWDFIIGIIVRGALGQKIQFLGKHQLFRPPWGWFFKAVGGTPVNRTKSNKLVADVVEIFKSNPEFKLALTPEGTRSPVKRWKTGFYHIARAANVPIVTIGLDFSCKTLVIKSPLEITGDIGKDMPVILEFFRSIKGRHPKEIPYFQSTEPSD